VHSEVVRHGHTGGFSAWSGNQRNRSRNCLQSLADTRLQARRVNEARILADVATGTLAGERPHNDSSISARSSRSTIKTSPIWLGLVSRLRWHDGHCLRAHRRGWRHLHQRPALRRLRRGSFYGKKLIWKYDPQSASSALNGSYFRPHNGGVAVWNGKVYVGTGDCA